MAGISSKAAVILVNKKKYNGIEWENDFDLAVYDAFFRELDPQVGRWWQIDPKTESMERWSPYASNYDNPITYSDLLGDEPEGNGSDGPPSVGTRILSALTGFFEEMGHRAQVNFAKDVEWVKNTANTLSTNAKANWEAGNTIPQVLVNDIVNNPLSLVTGVAEVNVVRAAAGLKVVQSTVKYEVGAYNKLVANSKVGDGLDIHHVPQQKPAGQLISGYDKNKAPSIALPNAEHKMLPKYKGKQTAGSPRNQLAKDIKDLRKYTFAPNQSLQQLIDFTKQSYPKDFLKPKKP